MAADCKVNGSKFFPVPLPLGRFVFSSRFLRLCSAMTWERMRLSVSSLAPPATDCGSLCTQKRDCLFADALLFPPRFAFCLAPRTLPRVFDDDDAADDILSVLGAVEMTPMPLSAVGRITLVDGVAVGNIVLDEFCCAMLWFESV